MGGFRALVPAQFWYDLLQTAKRNDYKPHETLLSEGASGTQLPALQAGRVAVLSGGLLGALRGPGDLLGEMSAQDGGARSATVVALEDCVAYEIWAEPFRRLLIRHQVEDRFQAYLLGKFRQSLVLTATRAARPVERCADVFARVVELAGDHPDPFLIPMSQTWLAQAFGLSRRVVVQAVGELRDRGVLSDTNPIRVADPEALGRVNRSVT